GRHLPSRRRTGPPPASHTPVGPGRLRADPTPRREPARHTGNAAGRFADSSVARSLAIIYRRLSRFNGRVNRFNGRGTDLFGRRARAAATDRSVARANRLRPSVVPTTISRDAVSAA